MHPMGRRAQAAGRRWAIQEGLRRVWFRRLLLPLASLACCACGSSQAPLRVPPPAAQTLDASGYRGNSLEEKDLWVILEDPDAEPEMRAAAARVLARARPHARVRIDGAIAAVRDEAVEKRLRIAVTADPQHAGAELVELEALEEPRRIQQPLVSPQNPSGHRWPRDVPETGQN